MGGIFSAAGCVSNGAGARGGWASLSPGWGLPLRAVMLNVSVDSL